MTIKTLPELTNELNNLVNSILSLSKVMKVPVDEESISSLRTEIVDWLRDNRDEFQKVSEDNAKLREQLRSRDVRIENLTEQLQESERKVTLINNPDNLHKSLLEKDQQLRYVQRKLDEAFEILSDATTVSHEVYE